MTFLSSFSCCSFAFTWWNTFISLPYQAVQSINCPSVVSSKHSKYVSSIFECLIDTADNKLFIEIHYCRYKSVLPPRRQFWEINRISYRITHGKQQNCGLTPPWGFQNEMGCNLMRWLFRVHVRNFLTLPCCLELALTFVMDLYLHPLYAVEKMSVDWQDYMAWIRSQTGLFDAFVGCQHFLGR